MKKIASIVTLALLAATTTVSANTTVSEDSYNARYTLSTSQMVGEVEQRPAAEVVYAGDFVNSDTVPVTVVERSVDTPVTSAR